MSAKTKVYKLDNGKNYTIKDVMDATGLCRGIAYHRLCNSNKHSDVFSKDKRGGFFEKKLDDNEDNIVLSKASLKRLKAERMAWDDDWKLMMRCL